MIALRHGATELTHEDYMEGILEVQAKKKANLQYYAWFLPVNPAINTGTKKVDWTLIFVCLCGKNKGFALNEAAVIWLHLEGK